MKYVYLILRILLGLIFVVFGADKIHHFIPGPMPPANSLPGMFMAVAVPTGWLKVIGLTEFLGGLFVLYGGTVPLGLVFLAPVTINILAFSFLVAGGGGGAVPGLVVTLFELVLFYAYRASFEGILTHKAAPAV
jgi:uncharacterized membrane protein YphA (DoxX/SURF4 family)